jgi:hypothetical protein
MTAALFALLGVVAGVVEVALLWRATGSGADPFGVILRLFLVGSVLLVAAVAGQLLPASAGWAAGFGASATIVARESR